MNLIKKLQELRQKKFDRNWQQSGQTLTRPQYYFLNCACNNDCKRKSDTACSKHLLKMKYASRSADLYDTGNQMNSLHEIKIKNDQLLID